MRCNEKETLSLGAMLSQSSDPPQASKQQHNVRSSHGSLKSLETSSCSKNLPPPSPTTSVSESNVIASSDNNLLQSLKLDGGIDVEVQSPDNSLWDCLLADQIDSPSDFMLISSPRRDYMMISSPKRDYMVSSPRRGEYMISSPKRDYMITVTSPKRTNMNNNANSVYGHHNYGYVHGVQSYATTSSYSSVVGKSPSPLHKVYNSSTASYSLSSAAQYGGGDQPNLALPTMDALFDEYGLYSNLKEECSMAEVYDASGAILEAEAAVGGMTATLLECLSMPSLNERFGESVGYVGMSGAQQQLGVENGGVMAKAEIGDGTASSVGDYHGFLGTIACDQSEQVTKSSLLRGTTSEIEDPSTQCGISTLGSPSLPLSFSLALTLSFLIQE